MAGVAIAVGAIGIAGAACAGGSRQRGGSPAPRGRVAEVRLAESGASSAGAAVDRFLTAAQSNDARAMGVLFGTPAGPVAARDAADEVDKRMRALACYLSHDGARVVDEVASSAGGGRRTITVALRQRELARETRFVAVPGPSGRWYVESFDIERLSDFCRPQ